MKFTKYLKKLKDSDTFKDFKKDNPDAYLGAGFFIMDFESGDNKYQIDFGLPDKKIATFILGDDRIDMKISENATNKKLQEIEGEIKTDLSDLKKIVKKEMKNKDIDKKVNKIIAILQRIKDKNIWNLQCILPNMLILNIHVKDSDHSIVKFKKYSLSDIVKPLSQLKKEKSENKE